MRPLQDGRLFVDREHNRYSPESLSRTGRRLQIEHFSASETAMRNPDADRRAAGVMKLYVIEAAMLDCGWALTSPSVQTSIQHAWNWAIL